MWFLDEPRYYEEGQYLRYDNPVVQYIADLEQSRHNGRCVMASMTDMRWCDVPMTCLAGTWYLCVTCAVSKLLHRVRSTALC
jgi:hypothetical protein